MGWIIAASAVILVIASVNLWQDDVVRARARRLTDRW